MPNKIFIRPLFESDVIDEAPTIGEEDLDNPIKNDNIPQNKVEFNVVKRKTMVFPLIDDVQFNVQSDLQSWSDMVPGIQILGKLQALGTSGGTVSQGVLNLQNMFDAPRWERTMPIEFNVNLGFYTINNPEDDVYNKMKKLIAMTILSRSKKTGKIIPPGLYLPAAAAAKVGKGPANSELVTTAKLISLKIPGIIFMKYAMIKQATPVFSKHLTDTGMPLWGTLELSIVGLTPAFEDDFNGDTNRA